MRSLLLLSLTLAAAPAFAQKQKKQDAEVLAGLRQHVEFLASDVLEGRRTGSEGERLAANYIELQFQKAGLQPKGSSGFLQSFEVNEGWQVLPGTRLLVNGKPLGQGSDFFPLAWSAGDSLNATPSLALQEKGMPWFFDLKEVLEENRSNPHFDLDAYLHAKAQAVQKKGATALIIYNTSSIDDQLRFDPRYRGPREPIPVVYVKKEALQRHLADESGSYEVRLVTQVAPRVRNGHNVIGYIDNNAPHTVVIGAHYDHLGQGEDGNSLHHAGGKAIHYGADDNASGTAALLELARLLKTTKSKSHNYLLIAFSGEELGLFGSKYFVENPTIDLSQVNYMINMDMVGRLNDSSRTLTVGGYGTTPTWGALYSQTGKKGLFSEGLSFRFDSSGTGPSDHTSFYRKNIPVLFYFTGLHSDYHKPGDVASKINYNGQLRIVRHIESLLRLTDKPEKLTFTKTREQQTGSSARFSVSLGVMPDYTYSGNGLRIDGVSEGKAAQKAGLQAGDIITALGEHKVSSVESYMQALGKFKKGDSTQVYYQRKGQEFNAPVQF